jgi:hypothetical protein
MMQQLVQKWQFSLLTALCAASVASSAQSDPVITGFNRESGPVHSVLIIYGSGFGEAQGANHVLFGGRMVPALAWSPVAVYALINPFAYDPTPLALDTAYPVQVVTKFDNKVSNSRNFTLTSEPVPVVTPAALPGPPDQPSISGFQRAAFCADSLSITIYGEGFGSTQGGSSVSVTVPFKDSQGVPFTKEYLMPALAWSENAINLFFSPPAGAELGTYTVTVRRSNGKTASRAFPLIACPTP